MKTNFYDLNPDSILHCVEKNGFIPTGEVQQLNSYENRVFSIKLEKSDNSEMPSELIAKFYRPGRWSRETILDEHLFEIELHNENVSVATPFQLLNGSTLDEHQGIYFCFFNKIRGRLIQELTPNQFKKIGRWLAQLHNVAEVKKAPHRSFLGPTLDHKWQQLDLLFNHVSPEVKNQYFEYADLIFNQLDSQLDPKNFLRLHGDLHRGNILESPTDGFVVVDFDDFINGPSVQDMWMLLPDENFHDTAEFNNLVEGYEELRHFPFHELELIPLLRGYRIINYACWILNRWSDPSFPKIFPEFNTYKYWAEETESLARIARTL